MVVYIMMQLLQVQYYLSGQNNYNLPSCGVIQILDQDDLESYKQVLWMLGYDVEQCKVVSIKPININDAKSWASLFLYGAFLLRDGKLAIICSTTE